MENNVKMAILQTRLKGQRLKNLIMNNSELLEVFVMYEDAENKGFIIMQEIYHPNESYVLGIKDNTIWAPIPIMNTLIEKVLLNKSALLNKNVCIFNNHDEAHVLFLQKRLM